MRLTRDKPYSPDRALHLIKERPHSCRLQALLGHATGKTKRILNEVAAIRTFFAQGFLLRQAGCHQGRTRLARCGRRMRCAKVLVSGQPKAPTAFACAPPS